MDIKEIIAQAIANSPNFDAEAFESFLLFLDETPEEILWIEIFGVLLENNILELTSQEVSINVS